MIERDGQNSTEDTTEKSGSPFGAVFAPDNDAVAFTDGSVFQFGRETPSELGQLAVSSLAFTNAACRDDGNVTAMNVESVDESGEVGSWQRLRQQLQITSSSRRGFARRGLFALR